MKRLRNIDWGSVALYAAIGMLCGINLLLIARYVVEALR
jgi:hypothetical protein